MRTYKTYGDDYVKKVFLRLFPMYTDVADYYSIGDMETMFVMSDRSKVIFDELNKTSKYIEAHSSDITELTEEEWLNEFSRKLKRKLFLSKMTKKELSEKTGISINTIYRYTKGERVPDIFSIKKIAKALNRESIEFTDFDYLI